ncbi:aquaporin Z [Amaricoccus sp.]|uniref:aquaporin Z n=1 Tax=Amaricoccus sp. TaxID=1872485 RepID=UPI001B45E1EE|nr:aquaporin Z [Amaricoccus sp.]MBP7241202.1 aquaporin Z [Amaricoccus sp.]
MFKKLTAEALGTFVLVFGGCGSAVLAAGFPELGIGFVGVSLAFGLTVLTMAYAVGGISGGHFNPAVTFGLAIANRFEWAEVIPYWVAQLVGGVLAALVLYVIASGQAGWTGPGGFASNGFGANSPGGYGLVSAFTIEVVLTAFFLVVILGATQRGAPAGFAPIAIGLALTLIHLVAIPVTNTAVNPARATAAALFAQAPEGNPTFLSQLWVFWLAPLVGAAVGGLIWDNMLEND